MLHIICYGQQIDSVETGIIKLGEKYKFHSDVLNEEIEIWVSFPRGYETGDKDYPVVYQLDGNFGFLFTAGLLKQLVSKSVPESILIGILSTDRGRDFTPPAEVEEDYNAFPTAGGAKNYIRMLEEELIPFVNKNFRTTEFRTLFGGSLGGLFVIYSLATKPDLFNAYLSIGPSLWWNNKKAVDYFEKRLKANPEMKALLFMTMGNEGVQMGENLELGKSMMEGFMNIVNILEEESPKNLRWGYTVNYDETHYSNVAISTLQGFDFFYKDWFVSDPVLEYLQNGVSSFELRSKRIKFEFGEDWDLSTFNYLSIMRTLNTLGKFPESRDLGLSLLHKDKSYFDLFQEIVDAFLGLGDTENAITYYKEAYKSGPGDPGINKIIDSLGIDKQSLVPQIKLSSEDLQKLAGEYVNNWNGNEISISFSRDTIIYFSPDGRFQLIPTEKNKSYFNNSATTVEFYFDDDKGSPASFFILRLRDGEELRCSRKDQFE